MYQALESIRGSCIHTDGRVIVSVHLGDSLIVVIAEMSFDIASSTESNQVSVLLVLFTEASCVGAVGEDLSHKAMPHVVLPLSNHDCSLLAYRNDNTVRIIRVLLEDARANISESVLRVPSELHHLVVIDDRRPVWSGVQDLVDAESLNLKPSLDGLTSSLLRLL